MHPNKFSVGSWQSAVSNPDSQLTPIFLPCKLPTANFFLNSTLSFSPTDCRLPTANFFLNSALSTSKIILLPLMPNSQNSYGLLILDFKEGNISGITECNKQFT